MIKLMDNYKLAMGSGATFTVFDHKIIHSGGNYLIINTELIPRMTIGFPYMLNCPDQLTGIRENPYIDHH